MSVRIAFYHPDRLVIGLFEGQMQLSDFVEFALEIQKNDLIHYRKILNVIDAHPGFTEQELRALVRLIREAPTDKPRGAVAFVADPERGEFANLFASLEVDGRPARVFRSIHDARKWLTEMPPVRD